MPKAGLTPKRECSGFPVQASLAVLAAARALTNGVLGLARTEIFSEPSDGSFFDPGSFVRDLTPIFRFPRVARPQAWLDESAVEGGTEARVVNSGCAVAVAVYRVATGVKRGGRRRDVRGPCRAC